MKRKILAFVLAVVMLSGCTMPDVSFDDADSPLFVDDSEESSADVSESAETQTDSSGGMSGNTQVDGQDTGTESSPDDSSAIKDSSVGLSSGSDLSTDGTDADRDLSTASVAEIEKKEKDSEKKKDVGKGIAAPLGVMLVTGGERRYDSVSDTISADVSYTWPALVYEAEKVCPELGTRLNQYENSLRREMSSDLAELEKEISRTSGNSRETYRIERTILPVRADSLAFSTIEVELEEKGTESGIKLASTNIDSQTGLEIELTDIIETKTLGSLLNEAYEETYAGIPIEDFEQMISVYKDTDYVWTITAEGLNFYFADEESMQPVTVQISRKSNPDIFTDAYADSPESYTLPVNEGRVLAFDKENDGRTDLLTVTSGDNSVTVELNGKSASGRLYLTEIIPVLVRTVDELYYIYVNCPDEKDNKQLAVFDINGDIPVFIGTLPNAGFPSYYDEEVKRMTLPANAQAYLLESGINLLGTYNGTRLYTAGKDGMPEAKDDWYDVVDDVELTVLTKFAADAVDPLTDEISEEGIIIQKGAELKVYRTDGESIVDLLTEDNKTVRVDVDTSGGWPQTIDGTDIEKLFDGIRFAE